MGQNSDETKAMEYAEKLAEMIRCKTVSTNGNEGDKIFCDFHELLKKLFPNLFRACDYEDFNGSFLLCWKGKKHDQPILLMNHHDVVEAPGEWKYPPFDGVIAEEKVWGRGTLDTKGGLFAMLQAADELIAEGFCPEQDVWFESACTEETDGNGADTISKDLEKRGIRFQFVLDEGGMNVYDPLGGAEGNFAMIGVGEKGCADIKFTAKSNGGHASTPVKNTPLVRLGKFMNAVEESNIFPLQIAPTIKEMFRRFAPTMKDPLKFIFANSDLFSPLIKTVMPKISALGGALLHTTLAFTMAGGSQAPNVLPQEAWIIGNMRYSHHQGGKASIEAVKKIADKFDIEVTVLDGGFESDISDYNSDGFKRIEDAVRKCFTEVLPCPYIMTGASDCRYMSRVSNCCLRYTPFQASDEQIASIHGLNENVDIKCLAPAVDFYKVIMGYQG